MAIKERINEFVEWVKVSAKYLTSVKSILSNQIPEYEEEIINHVRLVEAHYARVGCLLAEVNGWLDSLTGETMEEVSASELKTVREREIKTEQIMSSIRATRNKLQTLLDAIELRVTLSQSILKQQRAERRLQG